MDRIRIALCDANRHEAEGYAKICRSVGENKGISVEIKIYLSNDDLMFDLEDDAFKALFSIMIIDPEGGFAATPAIARQEGFDGLILYLSHSTVPHCYHQAFDAEAYNYVQKGIDPQTLYRFQSVFAKTLGAAKQLDRHYIAVSCAGEYRQINVKDIRYFEAMDKMVRVEYNNESFQFPSTMQSLEERLDGRGFVRTHRSYIVAIDAIQHLNSDDVTLNNGRRVPVSRSYYSAVKSAKIRWQL